ncbi:unnamed protein product [Pipistrellus nathusii]|uniref:TFIIF beta subunit N-terminal domain-containing protein n=1 Tax=Pipistrellus nathusii TaxID=59473 RepID=A0ABN9ZVN4_PIPNA
MASGGCRPETHPRSRSLDLSGIRQEQPLWLVKVPKYLSQQWAGASGSGEVGKLQVVQNQHSQSRSSL